MKQRPAALVAARRSLAGALPVHSPSSPWGVRRRSSPELPPRVARLARDVFDALREPGSAVDSALDAAALAERFAHASWTSAIAAIAPMVTWGAFAEHIQIRVDNGAASPRAACEAEENEPALVVATEARVSAEAAAVEELQFLKTEVSGAPMRRKSLIFPGRPKPLTPLHERISHGQSLLFGVALIAVPPAAAVAVPKRRDYLQEVMAFTPTGASEADFAGGGSALPRWEAAPSPAPLFAAASVAPSPSPTHAASAAPVSIAATPASLSTSLVSVSLETPLRSVCNGSAAKLPPTPMAALSATSGASATEWATMSSSNASSFCSAATPAAATPSPSCSAISVATPGLLALTGSKAVAVTTAASTRAVPFFFSSDDSETETTPPRELMLSQTRVAFPVPAAQLLPLESPRAQLARLERRLRSSRRRSPLPPAELMSVEAAAFAVAALHISASDLSERNLPLSTPASSSSSRSAAHANVVGGDDGRLGAVALQWDAGSVTDRKARRRRHTQARKAAAADACGRLGGVCAGGGGGGGGFGCVVA